MRLRLLIAAAAILVIVCLLPPNDVRAIPELTKPVIVTELAATQVPHCDLCDASGSGSSSADEPAPDPPRPWVQPSPDTYNTTLLPPDPQEEALALAALRWLGNHLDAVTQADYISQFKYKVVVDYAAQADQMATYPFANLTDWALLTAFLPAGPAVAVLPNQVALGPPNPLNLRTLWASMNLFDVQLLLRPTALRAAARIESLDELLGNTLPLARRTLLLLPCDVADEAAAIAAAVQWVQDQHYVIGSRLLQVTVRPLTTVTVEGCQRQLFEVKLERLARGTRHTWCYYSRASLATGAWLKFVLHYNAGEKHPLRVQRDPAASASAAAAGWSEGKTIRDWLPNMNYGDVLGWGVSAAQRLLLFWDLLQEPYWPDYNTHNFVVSQAARVQRIDKEIKSLKKHPPGVKYVRRLRADSCLPTGMLTVEHACGNCARCLGGAEHSYQPRARPSPACRQCLLCLRRRLQGGELNSTVPRRALEIETGTGKMLLTPELWGTARPCLTALPQRDGPIDARFCGVAATRPSL